MSDRPDPPPTGASDPAPRPGDHRGSRPEAGSRRRDEPWTAPAGRPDPFAPQVRPGSAQPRVSLHKRVADREQVARTRLKRAGGPLALAGLLIWKVGRIVLVALGKAAFLFKIPLLGSVLSGAVSIGAYALLWGWSFAIGIVVSLLVHELGHVAQLRREGMPVKALNFVPFLGAYVMSDRARTPDQQARISIAGPIAGTVLASLLLLVAGGDPMLEAIAYTGFFLNLLNLLPLPMLDGGGVGTLFTSGWWLGLAAVLGGVALASGAGLAAIAALAALFMAFARRSGGFAIDPPDGVPFTERVKAATLYAAVIAVCAFGMAATFRDRTGYVVDEYGSAASPAVLMAGDRNGD